MRSSSTWRFFATGNDDTHRSGSVIFVGEDSAFEHKGEGIECWLPTHGPSLPTAPGGVGSWSR